MTHYATHRVRGILITTALHLAALPSAIAVDIKLVHGAPNQTPLPSASLPPVPFRPPKPWSGPPAFEAFAVEPLCVTGTSLNYAYTVCPFHNVTQREIVTYGSGLVFILGIWDAWEVTPGPLYGKQLYTDGNDAGCTKRRAASVSLVCDEAAYTVTGISEPATCEYALTLHCPEACTLDWRVVLPTQTGLPATPLEVGMLAVPSVPPGAVSVPVGAAVAAVAGAGVVDGVTTNKPAADAILAALRDLRSRIDNLEKLVAAAVAASPSPIPTAAGALSGWIQTLRG